MKSKRPHLQNKAMTKITRAKEVSKSSVAMLLGLYGYSTQEQFENTEK